MLGTGRNDVCTNGVHWHYVEVSCGVPLLCLDHRWALARASGQAGSAMATFQQLWTIGIGGVFPLRTTCWRAGPAQTKVTLLPPGGLAAQDQLWPSSQTYSRATSQRCCSAQGFSLPAVTCRESRQPRCYHTDQCTELAAQLPWHVPSMIALVPLPAVGSSGASAEIQPDETKEDLAGEAVRPETPSRSEIGPRVTAGQDGSMTARSGVAPAIACALCP